MFRQYYAYPNNIWGVFHGQNTVVGGGFFSGKKQPSPSSLATTTATNITRTRIQNLENDMCG
ncbi:hypothetical protein DERF_013350 [Dermatophagoides farinae]|uniref:Uncharacterized protein n=1 Tax=Dermatophagoides farinae TaxID=6954 RepID=A0A922L284_DERFA|nr:hypothetical protein DERF_013350 [Dermatophagoides farinae]